MDPDDEFNTLVYVDNTNLFGSFIPIIYKKQMVMKTYEMLKNYIPKSDSAYDNFIREQKVDDYIYYFSIDKINNDTKNAILFAVLATYLKNNKEVKIISFTPDKKLSKSK
jgi:hypothetical protein